MLTKIEKKQCCRITKICQLFLLFLIILCGSSFKIASCESNEYLKGTAVKNLRESDPVLKEIIYQAGSFSSFYDKVTQIGHTPCCFPQDKAENFSGNNIISNNSSSPVLGGEVGKMDGREWVDGTKWPYSAHGHMTMKGTVKLLRV